MKKIVAFILFLIGINYCFGQYYQSVNISNSQENSDHSCLAINSSDNLFMFWVESNLEILYKNTINGNWSEPISVFTSDPSSIIKELSVNMVADTCHLFWIEQNSTESMIKYSQIFNEIIGDNEILYQHSNKLNRLKSVSIQNEIGIGFYQEKPNTDYCDIIILNYLNKEYSLIDSSYNYYDFTLGYDANSILWFYWFGNNNEIYSKHIVENNSWSQRDTISIFVPFCKDIDCEFNRTTQLFNLALAGEIATALYWENGLFFAEGYDSQWSKAETIIEQTSLSGRVRYSEYPQIVVNSEGNYKIFFEDDYSISIAEKDSQNIWVMYNILPSTNPVLHSSAINSEDSIFITYKDDNNVFIAYEVKLSSISSRDNEYILKSYYLFQNYPNPFNPTTTIEFDLPRTSKVTLKIYNILGEDVATLVSERLSAGLYMYEWDASNMANGVYLYRLEAGDFIETRKMILMR
jgi:hypothetical protein